MSSFLSRYYGPLLLFLGGLGLIALAPFITSDRSDSAPPPDEPRTPTLPTTKYPGARQPPAVSAAVAGLNDMEEVVGVVVRGKARAYALKALQGRPQNHVINDLVAGAPLTVTYCDIGRCIKAFTASGSEPLEVNVGGFQNGDMILNVEGRLYSQKSGVSVEPKYPGRLPFEAATFEVTTWKKWREAHPDTDVLVEVPAPAAEPTRAPVTSPPK